MGQYYKPVNLEKKQFLYSHDYGNGLKLMEHSWLGNLFVDAIERLLILGGAWYKTPIVWAGDYAESEKDKAKKAKGYNLNTLCYLKEYDETKKLYIQELKNHAKKRNRKLYLQEKQLFDKIEPLVAKKKLSGYHFIVNHTKNEFIDKRKGLKDSSGWQIHPLPLMTCEGNGGGGGDFYGKDNLNLIGSWARNIISIEKKAPKGYKEIIFDLKE